MGKLAIGVLLAGVVLYVLVCAWMYIAQRRLMYLPEYTRVDREQTNFQLRNQGLTLRGWLLHPHQFDAVLYFGGNAEQIEHNTVVLDPLFPNRSVYLLAYRGYGASEGVPGEQALVSDALALYDEVRHRHPGGRIAVIGRSLGSGVAAAVAGQRDVDKLVLITPFDSMANTAAGHYPWLPVRWLLHDRYDSVARLQGFRRPVLVMRAGRDTVVPPARTDALVLSLDGKPVKVADFPQADHQDIQMQPRFATVMGDFLKAP